MGVSYQTRNRLRRKVHTAPLTAPAAPSQPAAEHQPAAARPHKLAWPLLAATAVAVTAFLALYR